MEPSELKVGNWINYSPKAWQSPNYIQAKDEDLEKVQKNPSHYMDIPITEEWLLDLGFEKGHDLFFKDLSQNRTLKFVVARSLSAQEWDFSFVEEENNPSFRHQTIKYIHQLQNIYFAFTNEELNKTS